MLESSSMFSYADSFPSSGHRSHMPSIIHLPYGNPIESDLASGNNYIQEVIELFEEGLIEIVI